ncbi:PD-(D/E)XK nuclease family protein [Marinobacter sp. F4216]|uniref:PDDEXK-like family protein n=1 Tax=Marinobacter sp. F4216 TaxID=2874281 RepID=UPI001CC091DF|nr:PD-(D/E)XK nuclease family protein [Marinobacter sp. F4216]MBZ2169465.1 PD-(D/E)XK nuclease family protein [Marinobacter sp. F4216]
MKTNESESHPSDPTWEKLLDDYTGLQLDRSKRIEEGKNDFNLLASVLKVNDEVRLHTRFLFAMFNPKARHFQGVRFLELFLQVIKKETFINLNPDTLTIKKEYCPVSKDDQIDLYISDGKKTIVIENKLNALDQPGQVKRYLRGVGADGSKDFRDTLFIYLTKGRSVPSQRALAYPPDKQTEKEDPEPLRVFNNEVIGAAEDKPWALYQNLSYCGADGGIQSWLNDCFEVVKDRGPAENIRWAIRDYRDAVKRATGEYSSNVKSLKEHFEDNNWAGDAYHHKAIQFAEELRQAHKSWLHEAMTQKLDSLFQAERDAGTLVRIGPNDGRLLEPYLSRSEKRKAKDLIYQKSSNFFGEGRTTLRGSFFLVTGDSNKHKDQVVLMLFYGREYLHVGCLFSSDEKTKMCDVKSVKELASLKRSLDSIFLNAHTQKVPLASTGILSLANFERERRKGWRLRRKSNFGEVGP